MLYTTESSSFVLSHSQDLHKSDGSFQTSPTVLMLVRRPSLRTQTGIFSKVCQEKHYIWHTESRVFCTHRKLLSSNCTCPCILSSNSPVRKEKKILTGNTSSCLDIPTTSHWVSFSSQPGHWHSTFLQQVVFSSLATIGDSQFASVLSQRSESHTHSATGWQVSFFVVKDRTVPSSQEPGVIGSQAS